MVVIGQKWLFSCKSCSIWARVVVFGQSGIIWAEWEYSGKPGCIRAKVVVFSGKVIVIGQKFLY